MLNSEFEKQIVKLTEFIDSHFFGKYQGIVQSVGEEENLGCVKVKVPEVYGDVESPWAKPCVPLGGENFGFFMLPTPGNLVWIEFEAGNISRPIWSGFLWAENEIPESAGTNKRIIMTPIGHKIIFDDDSNEIMLIHSSDSEIKMTDNEISLKIGNSQIVLTSREVNINNGALVIK